MIDKQPPVEGAKGETASTVTAKNIAESPWLWMALFTAIGLLGLVVIAPKYGVRQARMEQRYQHRLKAYAPPNAAMDGNIDAGDDPQEFSEPEPPPATAWPVVAATAVALFVAIVGLIVKLNRGRGTLVDGS